MPLELGHALVAELIAAAGGAWIDSHSLTLGVLADSEVGPLIRAACAAGESGHTNPDIQAGNVVGWWSRSWTVGHNPYMDRFEREGNSERKYRYRVRDVST